MENAIVKVEECEKNWTLVGEVGNWEDFFMDETNFMPIINFVKEKARGLIADPTTKDGQITIKSLAKHIGQIEKAIADKGLEVARVLKEKPKKIDGVRKRVKDTLIMYKEEVLAPIKEIEARQAEIVEIENLPAQGIGCDSAGIRMLLDRLEEMAKKPEYWKESAKDAESAVIESKRQLNDMLASAEKAEADARELEELRKHKEEIERKEREKQEAELKKAQEAATKLAKEKEEAEAKAREAEEAKLKAEEEKKEAERKANEAMDKLTEDQRKEVDSPKIEPIFPETERERQGKINREAMEAIAKYTDNEVMAKSIVIAIVKGRIPHVRIMY